MNNAKYGNKVNNNIKVLHWNKGPSNFKTKQDHIRILIDRYKPNIISLSEANYNITENKDNHVFLDFNIEYTDK